MKGSTAQRQFDPREDELFARAIEIEDQRERTEFVARECGTDAALRRGVEELLRWHDADDGFLETPLILELGASQSWEPGAKLGSYRLVERLGEGSYGIVFLAEQEFPLHRQVAIKVLRTEAPARELVARFHAERQLLARMNHPNIAVLFDAGETPDTRPYFVMEAVLGKTLDRFFEDRDDSLSTRLEHFLTICDAVQHAHQKGIVHRDLKPSNVIVADDRGRLVVKVIDFGIAKMMLESEFDTTVGANSCSVEGETHSTLAMTRRCQYIGTPSYMSPEQTTPDGDVDTRADIYSLGAILYRMLVGVTPLESCGVPIEDIADAFRLIRESPPAIPSRRVAAHLPNRRGLAPPASRTGWHATPAMLRGDLDAILLKALAKVRSSRYQTVQELAADVRRYLQGHAVLARRQRPSYVAAKFIRRHWVVSAAAFLVGLAVVTGACIAWLGLHQATAALREEAIQRQQAEMERDRSQRISTLLENLMSAGHTDQGHPVDYTVRQLLVDFSTEFEQELEVQPDIEASVRRVLGRSFWSQGDFVRAAFNLERALVCRLKEPRPNPYLIAQSRVDYALCLFRASRIREAEEQARKAMETLDAQPPSEERVWANRVLSGVSQAYGNHNEAIVWAERAKREAELTFGQKHPLFALMCAHYAERLVVGGRYKVADAESLFALGLIEQLRNEHHVDVAFAQQVRSKALWRVGRLADSELIMRQAIETHEKFLGMSQPLASDYVGLSQVLLAQKENVAAEKAAREAVRIADALSDERNLVRTHAYQNLANMVIDTSPDEAVQLFSRAIDLKRNLVGAQPELVRLLFRRAFLLQQLERHDEAMVNYREAYNIVVNLPREELQVKRPLAADSMGAMYFASATNLSRALLHLERTSETEELVRDSRQILEEAQAVGANTELIKLVVDILEGRVAMAKGNLDLAQQAFDSGWESVNQPWGIAPMRVQVALVRGDCLIRQENYQDAQDMLLQIMRLIRRRPSLSHPWRKATAELIVSMYVKSGNPSKAAAWQRRLGLE